MKLLLSLCISLLLVGCQSNKTVYWCGDHACINKKEKEEYFKNNMIVEKRITNKKVKEFNTTLDKIKKQSGLEIDKNTSDNNVNRNNMTKRELAKQKRLDKKRRLKEQKELTKQLKNEEKLRIKQEKRLKKKVKLEKKLLKKQPKINSISEDKSDTNISKSKIVKNKFEDLVKNVIENNKDKPYPDINNNPN